jgi:hypothetical protein
MHTDPNQHEPNEERLRNPEVSFEKRDLGARNIILFFVSLFLCGAAIHLVIWGVYEGFMKVNEQQQPEVSPLAPKRSAPPESTLQNTPSVNLDRFPEPRLQISDETDMSRFLWQEDQLLNAAPWQDQSGAVHIPIELAMRIIAQRGLPARPASQPQPMAPMDQTQSGNVALNEIQKAGDAGSIPGEPAGYDTEPSAREKEAPLPGVRPEQPHTVTGSAPGIPDYVPQPKK